MKSIALRIPDELKREMSKVKINWSDYIRSAISEAVESKDKREWNQRLRRLMKNRKQLPAGTSVTLVRQLRGHA